MVGSIMSFIAVPAMLGLVVDQMADGTWEAITDIVLLMAAIVVGTALFVFARAASFNTMSDAIAKNIRYDVFFSLINKDVAFFDENKTGEMLSRISSDTSVIQDGLSTNISMMLRSLVQAIVTILLMAYISPKLTGVLLAGLVPIVLSANLFGAWSKKV